MFFASQLDFEFQVVVSELLSVFRSSRPEVFLRKGVLKICSKVTGELKLHFNDIVGRFLGEILIVDRIVGVHIQ